MTERLVARAFYRRAPDVVAPELLNKILVTPRGAGRIVEVEAYDGEDDPASHAFRGETPRTQVMFGEAGHVYVYRSYGSHWCVNLVCRDAGRAAAVLVRALAPLRGLDEMRTARPAAQRDRDLCRGPGRLCAALGIDNTHNGTDATRPQSDVRIVDDRTSPPSTPTCTPRVGISKAVDRPWRWYVPGDPHVSRS